MPKLCKMDFAHIDEALLIRQSSLQEPSALTLTSEMLEKALLGPCTGYMAYEDDMAVGFVLANKRNQSIWGLFVLPEFWGKGIGKMLLQEASLWLFSHRKGFFYRPVQTIYISCIPGSIAQSFYEHLGWQKAHIRDGEQHLYLKRTNFQ